MLDGRVRKAMSESRGRCAGKTRRIDLETVFEGSLEGGLRIRGTRIGAELIVGAFRDGLSPEQIVHQYYPGLSLEQVYCAITCFLQHRKPLEAYCARLDRADREAVARQESDPSEAVRRFRDIKRRRPAA
jgi:uncharacterized protein (DUF433 family)